MCPCQKDPATKIPIRCLFTSNGFWVSFSFFFILGTLKFVALWMVKKFYFLMHYKSWACICTGVFFCPHFCFVIQSLYAIVFRFGYLCSIILFGKELHLCYYTRNEKMKLIFFGLIWWPFFTAKTIYYGQWKDRSNKTIKLKWFEDFGTPFNNIS